MNKIEKIINRDINNAYDSCNDFRQSDAILLLSDSFEDLAVSFSLFCAENTISFNDNLWRMRLLKPTFKTSKQLYEMWKDEMD